MAQLYESDENPINEKSYILDPTLQAANESPGKRSMIRHENPRMFHIIKDAYALRIKMSRL